MAEKPGELYSENLTGGERKCSHILHHTSYTDIIAIGVTGSKNECGELEYSIGVYYVSKKNLGVGQKVDEYTDLSFLKKENFDSFIDQINTLQLTQEELDRLKEKREQEISASLVKLNNDIYQNEKGLGENDRVYLVAASIIATLGVPGKVAPLDKDDLKSSSEEGNTDGDIIVRKIKAFLNEKQLPREKKELMGDGSSNILNKDSLTDFNGNYGYGNSKNKFPATAFVLNPPYSAKGNGMIFVERALSMMSGGYAAIIIQNSAGSGKATEYNKKILMHNTLLASIKMPIDLFIGKSSVQTNIYVFRVGEAHQKDDVVKFIDFSNDGYTRSNRKKASVNLRDTDHAKERYQEVVDLVRYGKGKLRLLTDKEYYEGHIDPESGEDWNQTAPIDTKPTLEDFKKTVSDYLAWEVSTLLKNQNQEDDCLKK